MPEWWPRYQNKLCAVVFRIMRVDQDDLTHRHHPIFHEEHGSDRFCCHTLAAVAWGSRQRSPFWHASVSLNSAYRWRAMADQESHRWGDVRKRITISIDILSWYRSGKMPDRGVIDLSSEEAQRAFFRKTFDDYGFDERAGCVASIFPLILIRLAPIKAPARGAAGMPVFRAKAPKIPPAIR